MKRLHHYTSIERWRLISESGRLNTTESNLSRDRLRAGPDVVWLTTDPDCQHGHGLRPTLDGTDKTRVRISIELPNRDVHKWRDWATRHRIDPDWMCTLIKTAGGGAATWRVVEKNIHVTRWIEVFDRHEGTVLWPHEA